MASLRAALLCSTASAVAAWSPWADTTLNVSLVVSSQPETSAIYLGSPSVVRTSTGGLVFSHDFFGGGYNVKQDAAFTLVSSDDGQTWTKSGTAQKMYWATLFTRPGDASVYLIGTTDDTNHAVAQIGIARSDDGGLTWSATSFLTNSSVSYSTGPTPVLIHGGRIWRAFEHNIRNVWAAGFSSVVISAPLNATDLTDPKAWTLSGEIAFDAVAGLVPPSWNPLPALVTPNYGWLEGGAVEPVGGEGDGGINVLLRVNSHPSANKAALLYLSGPGATPQFVQWIDPFPGGMSKFTVRRDSASGMAVSGGNNGRTAAPPTGLYVTLSNNIQDDSVTLPPHCGAVALPNKPVSCCGFMETCDVSAVATCMWCHADSRNNLTLAVSPDLKKWTVISTVLKDDTGVPRFISELGTGFQYVDWNFDNGGADIIYGVRAGYRGSNNYHNANRMLFGIIPNWRSLVSQVAPELLR